MSITQNVSHWCCGMKFTWPECSCTDVFIYLILLYVYWCLNGTYYKLGTEETAGINLPAHLCAIWGSRSSPAAAPTVAPCEGAPCWRGVSGERHRHGLIASSVVLRRLAVPRQPINTAVLIITAVSRCDILSMK